MKKDEVTERMKELMSDRDRRELFGASGASVPPGPSAAAKRPRNILTRLEKLDHIDLINFCAQHDLFRVHSRMDMATTNEKGIPDFVLGIRGRLIAIEFKQPGKKLTEEQEEWRRKCVGPSECEYHVCYSSKEAIDLLIPMLCPSAP
jgi:VRR-NUC domain